MKQFRVKFIDMNQNGYDNNEQIGGEYATEIFEEGYDICDFYSDNANIVLDPVEGLEDWYTYTTLDDEKRYVYVRSVEEIID